MKIEITKVSDNGYDVYCTDISQCCGRIEKDKYGVWFTATNDFSLKAEDLEAIAKAMREIK